MIVLTNPFNALLVMVVILTAIVLLLCWIISRNTKALKELSNFLRIIAVN